MGFHTFPHSQQVFNISKGAAMLADFVFSGRRVPLLSRHLATDANAVRKKLFRSKKHAVRLIRNDKIRNILKYEQFELAHLPSYICLAQIQRSDCWHKFLQTNVTFFRCWTKVFSSVVKIPRVRSLFLDVTKFLRFPTNFTCHLMQLLETFLNIIQQCLLFAFPPEVQQVCLEPKEKLGIRAENWRKHIVYHETIFDQKRELWTTHNGHGPQRSDLLVNSFYVVLQGIKWALAVLCCRHLRQS